MPPRPAGTRRPRLLPSALVASVVVVAAAAGVLTVTAGPEPTSVQTCSSGQEWVTVHPVVVIESDWRPAELTPTEPSLAGCVDTGKLTPQQPTDARG